MSAQLRRVRADDVLAEQLVTALIDDGAGERPTNVLTAWAIPLWLTGIQASRVAPEKRNAIRAFKREAADVLYRHFSQPQQVALPAPPQPPLQAPTTLVPSEPIERPVAPPEGAAPDSWIEYQQRMIAFLEWRQDVEAWRGGIESRMESVEEMTRLAPELIERLGPATLSPEHQQSVQAYANRLAELTGAKHAAIYGELKDVFHVGMYKEIPESQWSEVAQWFQARIRRASGAHQEGRAAHIVMRAGYDVASIGQNRKQRWQKQISLFCFSMRGASCRQPAPRTLAGPSYRADRRLTYPNADACAWKSWNRRFCSSPMNALTTPMLCTTNPARFVRRRNSSV